MFPAIQDMMKKRLRKKKHLEEFRQMGFSIHLRFRSHLSPGEFDQFLDELIEDAVETEGLAFGGGGSHEQGLNGVVSRDHRYDSTTEEDRAGLNDWLLSRSEVVSCRVSGLWDLWHGSNPFDSGIVEE